MTYRIYCLIYFERVGEHSFVWARLGMCISLVKNLVFHPPLFFTLANFRLMFKHKTTRCACNIKHPNCCPVPTVRSNIGYYVILWDEEINCSECKVSTTSLITSEELVEAQYNILGNMLNNHSRANRLTCNTLRYMIL